MYEDEAAYSPFSYVRMLWAAIASVGWYLLGAAIALFFAAPYLEEKYTAWKRKKDEDEYTAKYHKNPDLWQETLRKQEEARQRMQERYKIAAAKASEEEEKRKEAKKQEIAKLIAKQDGGHRLGTGDGASTSSGSSSQLKNDYNPLTGDSNRGYRPPKRSCCGKGGCG